MAAGASPISTGIDENTKLLLQDHHLLIDRQFLQMGEVLGAGNSYQTLFCVVVPLFAWNKAFILIKDFRVGQIR